MKYGFIGCGNMGGALARALAKTTKEIMLSENILPKPKLPLPIIKQLIY